MLLWCMIDSVTIFDTWAGALEDSNFDAVQFQKFFEVLFYCCIVQNILYGIFFCIFEIKNKKKSILNREVGNLVVNILEKGWPTPFYFLKKKL